MKCDHFQKLPNVTMVDTVHVRRNMERNQHLGISDFYLALGDNGIATVAGSMSLDQAAKEIERLILNRDTMDINSWKPTSLAPSIPLPLVELYKKPSMVTSTAVNLCKWLRQDVKLGEGRLLAWSFPVDRDLMVATDKMMSGVNTVSFSLSSLVTWANIGKLKNGFKSGNRGLLVPGTGVSSWLDFMKIFIEVSKTVNF